MVIYQFHYTRFALPLERHEWSAEPIPAYFPLWARGYFRSECCTGGWVNGSTACEAYSCIHPLPRNEAGQVASTVFQFFDVTRPGIERRLNSICGARSIPLASNGASRLSAVSAHPLQIPVRWIRIPAGSHRRLENWYLRPVYTSVEHNFNSTRTRHSIS